MQDKKKVINLQLQVSEKEYWEIEDYLSKHQIRVQKDWLRETIMKEVRKDGKHSLPIRR